MRFPCLLKCVLACALAWPVAPAAVARADTGEFQIANPPPPPPKKPDFYESVTALQARIQELANQLRETRGALEVSENRARQLEARLETVAADMEFRLNALEERQVRAEAAIAAAAASPAPPSQPSSPPLSPPSNLVASPDSAISSTPTSTLSPGDGAAAPVIPPAADPPPAAPVVVLSPDGLYDAAMALLRRDDYAGAEGAFYDFLDQYPSHPLGVNALYWVGETYYVRGRYEDAAAAFAEAYAKDETAPKAPHSLLKMAMSLERLGRAEAACATWRALLDGHGDAEARILARARDALADPACRT